jgi:hypothetical protein
MCQLISGREKPNKKASKIFGAFLVNTMSVYINADAVAIRVGS